MRMVILGGLSRRLLPVATLLAVAAVTACATPAEQAAGLKAGVFVPLQCAGGKTFQARLAAEGDSVRVRTQHGSAELSSVGNGVFRDGDIELDARPESGMKLSFKGKPEAVDCRG